MLHVKNIFFLEYYWFVNCCLVTYFCLLIRWRCDCFKIMHKKFILPVLLYKSNKYNKKHTIEGSLDSVQYLSVSTHCCLCNWYTRCQLWCYIARRPYRHGTPRGPGQTGALWHPGLLGCRRNGRQDDERGRHADCDHRRPRARHVHCRVPIPGQPHPW